MKRKRTHFCRRCPFGAAFALSAKANAQGERSNRIDPHPVRQQVGIVSRVIDRSAWVRLCASGQNGRKNRDFGFFGRGRYFILSTRRIGRAPALPTKPMSRNIHAISTKHDRNEFDDDLALGALKHQVGLRDAAGKPSGRACFSPPGISFAPRWMKRRARPKTARSRFAPISPRFAPAKPAWRPRLRTRRKRRSALDPLIAPGAADS